MTRSCGTGADACTLCCKLLPVRELGKGAGERCRHQSRKGCGVYHKAGFPPSCGVWSCRWLTDTAATAKLRRPDRSGYVLDPMPDLVRLRNNETGAVQELPVMQVWVDPARRGAWRDPAFLDLAERLAAETGAAVLLRYSSHEAQAIFAPSLTSTGRWELAPSSEAVASATGSLLLDKLAVAG